MIMKNVRQKLADACKNMEMSRELNEFTSYMSTVANDELNPQGMLMMYACALDDVGNGKSGFALGHEGKFPQYLVDKKSQVLAQAIYFPQVIDEIADPEFAKEFRDICKQIFKIDPPKKINPKIEGKYPEYVTVAVDWWTKAIASPKQDNGEDMGSVLAVLTSMRKNKMNSVESVKNFKKVLADGIEKQIELYGYCYLDVYYHACQLLMEAGKEMKLDSMLNFPWKTYMRITPDKVEVSCGYGAPLETIWKK